METSIKRHSDDGQSDKARLTTSMPWDHRDSCYDVDLCPRCGSYDLRQFIDASGRTRCIACLWEAQ